MPAATNDSEALLTVPGIGPRFVECLGGVGITKVSQLKRRNPERLYEQLCASEGERLDPCVLYTLRCAIYYATEERHDPELLKWWNWKDSPAGAAGRES